MNRDNLQNKLDKKQLRRYLLKKRQQMTMVEWREKSDRIVTNLQTSKLFQEAETILAFFSFRQEPDLSPLFNSSEKRWGFPRCVGNSLMWHFWQPEDSSNNSSNNSLNVGNYGIHEPHPHAEVVDITEVDLILIPCVGCDLKGYRLGYGGGYYDRLLSSPIMREKITMGIVFELGYLPQLPRDHWDQPLDGVVWENGVHICRGKPPVVA